MSLCQYERDILIALALGKEIGGPGAAFNQAIEVLESHGFIAFRTQGDRRIGYVTDEGGAFIKQWEKITHAAVVGGSTVRKTVI